MRKLYRWVKRTVFPIFALLVVSGCSPDEGTETEPAKPNIIIIYGDDVGYYDIGAYGTDMIPTPNIDQLVADGIRFTSAYATSATCTPSRYSLLTGEYSFRNERAQILPSDAPLLIEPGSPTIPSVLKESGYRTAVVGKWHLGLGEGAVDWNGAVKPGPLEVGFDESFILPATNDRVPTVLLEGHHVQGLSEEDEPLRISYDEKVGDLPTGESHPDKLHYPADPQHSGTIVNGISRIGWQTGGQSAWWDDQQLARVFTERAQTFVEQNRKNPFFLFLSMHQNHVPRWPNEQFVGESKTGLRGDAVVELDWVVGQIVQKIEEMGIREETLIIFTSDNGPIFDDGYTDGSIGEANGHDASGPFRGGKYHAFEGGTRLPFIASWPGSIEKGTVSDAIISQVDLLASLADLAGVQLPENEHFDSRNLAHTLLGHTKQGREYVVQQGAGGVFGIRKGQWKLIESEDKPPEWTETKHNEHQNPLTTSQVDAGRYLYNLGEDPGETNDLADQHPEIVKELSNLLQEIRSGK
ncbi:arylsulfatase [Halalkalibaculum sp. DA3122]|uniref:sulfatase family protein n=1 Tax=Halalkalibaculum sp. DA3122 TaxID=3373607 RepID=UPI0037545799